MRLLRSPDGSLSPLNVLPGGVLDRVRGGGGAPPVSVDWGGPQVGMNPGAWTAEVESPAPVFVAPSFNGTVNTVIPDGAGGFYVGGNFTSVTDAVATYTTGYTRLVRLTPAGLVDPAFSCPMGAEVRAIALDSTGLYVGGDFFSANAFGGATRLRIGRVRPFDHATPGAVDAWRPDVNNMVSCLTIHGGKLYLGGRFTSTGGTGADYTSRTRNRIARITTGATATCDDWRPDFNGEVTTTLLDDSGKLYVGGWFSTTGGTGADYASTTRNRIARITTGATASCDAWRPDFSSVVTTALLDDSGKLYVGGWFSTTGGTGADYTSRTRNRIARITTGATATCDDWRPDFDDDVVALSLDGSGKLYVGGWFSTTGGAGADYGVATRRGVSAVSAGASAAPLATWDPSVQEFNATYGILQLTPTRVLIWGTFTSITNHLVSGGSHMAVLEAA
jgi:hypothetical protein